jgi:hypothetical protein
VTTRAGDVVGVVTGTEGAVGAVVGGDRVEPAPVPAEAGDVVGGDEVDVVGGDVVGVTPIAEAVGSAKALTWLGVSWNARPIRTPVAAVAPAATTRLIDLTRYAARSRLAESRR